MDEKARKVVVVAAEAADDDTGLIATRGDDAAARSAAHAVSNRLEAWRSILLIVPRGKLVGILTVVIVACARMWKIRFVIFGVTRADRSSVVRSYVLVAT